MKDAYQRLEKEFGKENVSEFKQVTKELIIGEVITTPSLKKFKAFKFLGLF